MLSRVRYYCPGARRLLDYGCGGGLLLRRASKTGWNAVGYDIGQRAIATCRQQGLDASDDLASLYASPFDVVFMNHVFEHIANQREVLAQCRSLLNDTGTLFVVAPNVAGLRARLAIPALSRRFNVDERFRAFPIHLFYFTPGSLRHLLEHNGFEVAAIETNGFGLEEFFVPPVTKTSGTTSRIPSRSSRGGWIKQLIKRAYFGAHLGENILLVARNKK